MASQTDKNNLSRLMALRKHKMDKAIVDIQRAKKEYKGFVREKEKLKSDLEIYQTKRALKHDTLFKELQGKRVSSIEDLNKHKASNQQLIVGEENLFRTIESCENRLKEKDEDIKKYENLLKVLNKKIESLKELSKVL